MNDTRGRDAVRKDFWPRRFLYLGLLTALTLAAACGGEHMPTTQTTMYPAGSVSDQELEKTLKFDARVQSHEFDGNKLVVEVNQSWISSPPGLQQRAAGEWYNMWQSARKGENAQVKGLEVLVRYEGDDVAKWTDEKGYQPIEMKKANDESDT